MMKIETERLYIRHFVNEDASICFEGWGTDEHLGDFIMGYPMNMDQMNSFVNAIDVYKRQVILVPSVT